MWSHQVLYGITTSLLVCLKKKTQKEALSWCNFLSLLVIVNSAVCTSGATLLFRTLLLFLLYSLCRVPADLPTSRAPKDELGTRNMLQHSKNPRNRWKRARWTERRRLKTAKNFHKVDIAGQLLKNRTV